MPGEPAATFCDVPFVDLQSFAADVAVIGTPHGTPCEPCEPGDPGPAAGGADAIRRALGPEWTSTERMDFDSLQPLFAGASVADIGDATHDPADGKANRTAIENAVKAVTALKGVPILLGGDGSITIPFIQGLGVAHRQVTVVQVNADIAWRDETDGTTHGPASTMRRISEMDHVKHMVQIGARGPGQSRRQECEHAVAQGARIFTARDIHKKGLKEALKAVPRHAPAVLSIDAAGLDPSLAPGVTRPAFGGLGYQQMLDIIQGVTERTRIIGADFVGLVPERDEQSRGARAMARLACNVITVVGL